MSNELSTIDANEVTAWEEFAREGGREWLPRGYEMMRFNGQDGVWSCPKIDPDDDMTGQEFIADIRSVYVGWTKFANNKPVDSRIVRAPARPPLRSELGDFDHAKWEIGLDKKPRDPWSLGTYLPLAAREDGSPYIFITSSSTGIRAVRALGGDFALKWREKGDAGRLPIVRLDKERFKSRFGSKLFAPIFCIIAWRKIAADNAGEITDTTSKRKALAAPDRDTPASRFDDDRENRRRGKATVQTSSGKVVDKRRKHDEADEDFDDEIPF